MMKTTARILTLFLSLGCFLVEAQNPLVKQWDKRFGGTNLEFLNAIEATTDSGCILVGSSASGLNGDKTQANWAISVDNFWIVKVDINGNKQWDKRYGGTTGEDCNAVQQTTDGGYILGGRSNSNISGDKTQDNWDITKNTSDYWVVKTDASGNIQWDKRFGGTKTDFLNSLQQTSDGGYILGGSSFSGANGDKTQDNWDLTKMTPDYWIVKIDALGNKQWDKRFGGTNLEELYTVKQTNDGGYILGGISASPISGDKTQATLGGWDYWIVKTDSQGNKQWDKRFGGSGSDFFGSLQRTDDGGYVLSGFSDSGISGEKTVPNHDTVANGSDFWVVKIDSSGNQKWDKTYGGYNYEEGYGTISKTTGGGFLIAGTSYSNISGDKTESNLSSEQTWVIKIDSIGNKNWDKTALDYNFLDDEIGFGIQTKDGRYIIGNYTNADIGGDKTQPNWDVTDSTFDYWILNYLDTTPIGPAPTVNLMSSDTSFCEKQCIDFTDLSTNNPTSWQWFLPGSNTPISTLQNPTNICYNVYGSFDVTLIACNAAGCDTLFLPGFINEYQIPSPTITMANDTLYSSLGVAYQWWNGNGIIPGATSNYFAPYEGGLFYVIITDSNGCQGASNSILVAGLNNSAFSNSQLEIIPNPNSGNFTILLNKPVHGYQLRIMNSIGQSVKSWQSSVENGQFRFDVSMVSFLSGFYTVELITNEKVYRQTFVKE